MKTLSSLTLLLCLFVASPLPAQDVSPIDAAKLLADLADDSSVVRDKAAKLAAELPEVSSELVDALTKAAASDKSYTVRKSAITTLGSGNVNGDRVESTLIAAMADPERGIRGVAVKAVADLGLTTDEARDALLNRMGDKDNSVVKTSQLALESIKSCTPSMLMQSFVQSAKTKGDVRTFGNTRLFLFDECCKTCLDDSQPAISRITALHILKATDGLSEEQRKARSDVYQHCVANTNPSQIRYAGYYCMPGLLDREQQNAVIIPAIRDSQLRDFQSQAILSAGRRRLYDAAPELVKLVTELPDSGTSSMCAQFACEMLTKIPENAREAVPDLIAAYERIEPLEDYRYCLEDLLLAIGGLGKHADKSVPFLSKIAADQNHQQSSAALAGLADVLVQNDQDVQPVIDILAAAIEAKRIQPNQIAMVTEKLGKHGAPVAAPLIDRMKAAPDYDQRAWVVSLGNLGPAASDAAPMMREMAAKADYPTDILKALAKIGTEPAEFAKTVAPMLTDDKKREAALRAIASFNSGSETLAPALVKLLDENNKPEETLYAIGSLRTIDRPTLAKVKAIADNERSFLSTAAAMALVRLYPDKERGVAYCLTRMKDISHDQVRMLRGWIKPHLDQVIKIAMASSDLEIQKLGERISKDPPDEYGYK